MFSVFPSMSLTFLWVGWALVWVRRKSYRWRGTRWCTWTRAPPCRWRAIPPTSPLCPPWWTAPTTTSVPIYNCAISLSSWKSRDPVVSSDVSQSANTRWSSSGCSHPDCLPLQVRDGVAIVVRHRSRWSVVLHLHIWFSLVEYNTKDKYKIQVTKDTNTKFEKYIYIYVSCHLFEVDREDGSFHLLLAP